MIWSKIMRFHPANSGRNGLMAALTLSFRPGISGNPGRVSLAYDVSNKNNWTTESAFAADGQESGEGGGRGGRCSGRNNRCADAPDLPTHPQHLDNPPPPPPPPLPPPLGYYMGISHQSETKIDCEIFQPFPAWGKEEGEIKNQSDNAVTFLKNNWQLDCILVQNNSHTEKRKWNGWWISSIYTWGVSQKGGRSHTVMGVGTRSRDWCRGHSLAERVSPTWPLNEPAASSMDPSQQVTVLTSRAFSPAWIMSDV